VLCQGGTPDKPNVRRNSASISFVPTDDPRRFAANDRTEPVSDNGYAWARIEEGTLTVYVLRIGANGSYNLQSYARTISGSGMDLSFTRIRDGEPLRSVTGKLIKQSD